MRLIDADALITDCQLAQKQSDRHGREYANAFYSGGGDVSTEWWCVEDMIENAPTIEQPEIIRCKDCKHRPKATRESEGINYGCSVVFPDDECPCHCGDEWYNWYPEDDFYCGRAERREEGGK